MKTGTPYSISIKYYLLLVFIGINLNAQTLSVEEKKLYSLIMEYREENGLKTIPISKSLTIVAQTHSNDLMENYFDNYNCNLHSWSSKGNWTPCCYTPDHLESNCMWLKPSEITNYDGYGFEISFTTSKYIDGKKVDDIVSANESLNGWKSSVGHNNVILNKDIWSDVEWKAIGIGIIGNYSCVWFGEELDDN